MGNSPSNATSVESSSSLRSTGLLSLSCNSASSFASGYDRKVPVY
jgi:hypothetical protein